MSYPCGRTNFLRRSSVVSIGPVAADEVAYSPPVTITRPPRSESIPAGAEVCARNVDVFCDNDSAWNQEKGWTQLLAASSAAHMGSTTNCASPDLNNEAWNFCKCDWIVSKDAAKRGEVLERNKAREPSDLQVRLAVRLTPTNANVPSDMQEKLRKAIQTAFATLEVSKVNAAKEGMDNHNTKQMIQFHMSDRMSIIAHSYDTSKIDITWYLQKTVTYGAALLQLKQVISDLKQSCNVEVDIMEVLVNMRPTTFKEQFCPK